MKKYIYIILSLFLFMPFMVNAETVTYNVCESGCEYASWSSVISSIQSLGDLSDKDIVINITSNLNENGYGNRIGSESNYAKSITINGNNFDFKYSGGFYADTIVINEVKTINNYYIYFYNPKKITMTNSTLNQIVFRFDENLQVKLNEIIDSDSLSCVKMIVFYNDMLIDNMDFSNTILGLAAGKVEIHDSKISTIISAPTGGNVVADIYNSSFDKLQFKKITTLEEYSDEVMPYFNTYDNNYLHYSRYEVNATDIGLQGTANITVYFDKEATVKAGNKLDLSSYLDYYTEDKEIENTIEDESIAKIENKELIGLKEGSTIVTVTTDEGHVVYRINLTVEKETIPEKIDKMTIKVPITGSEVKAWVLIVGGILLGIIGICICMLIKRKK